MSQVANKVGVTYTSELTNFARDTHTHTHTHTQKRRDLHV